MAISVVPCEILKQRRLAAIMTLQRSQHEETVFLIELLRFASTEIRIEYHGQLNMTNENL